MPGKRTPAVVAPLVEVNRGTQQPNLPLPENAATLKTWRQSACGVGDDSAERRYAAPVVPPMQMILPKRNKTFRLLAFSQCS